MKYLVLGGSSFYGGSFVEFLKEKGEKVQEYSRARGYEYGVTELPVNDDIVVNFIAEAAHVEASWDNPYLFLDTNVLKTSMLFEQLKRTQPRLYLHVSTPEVYGSSTFWVKEKTAFRPSTPYAVSRAAADMLLNAYWKAYEFPMIITRTANIYGQGQQDFRLIPKACRHISMGDRFSIHGKGSSVRSFIHVKDACSALYLLSQKGERGATYHISTAKTHSIREVVEMICALLKKDFKTSTEFKKDRLGKDHAYLLNSDKIRSLGWREKITLEEGLKDYANSISIGKGSAKVSGEAKPAL